MNSLYDELLSALHSVWNRRWLALAVAWGVCLLGWLIVAMVPNTYESRARIFIQLDDALAEQIGISVADRKRDIERIRQTLTSAVNLEKVVRSTRLGDSVSTPKEMEAAVLKLGKDIQVVSTQENIFEITAQAHESALSEGQNAKLAQEIAQKMIDLFREENLSGRGEMTQTLEFVNGQLAQRERELEAAEQRRQAFEAKNPDMVQGGLSGVQRLEAARTELRGIDADLAGAQSALAAINGQLAGTPATLPGAPGSGGPKSALAQAETDLAKMRARGLTDNHPDVVSVKNQIAQLRIAAQGDNGNVGGVPNPAYSSLQSIKADREASVQSLLARRTAIQSEVAELTSRQINDPEIAAEAQRIGRDYDVLRAQYDKLLQDREELRLRGEVKTEREAIKFQVVDPPTTPRAPVAPNRPLLLFGVLIVGIGAGVGAAFALGQLRGSYSTTTKLEKATGLPVLGAISLAVTEAGQAVRKRQLKLFLTGVGALGGLFVLLVAVEFVQRSMAA